MQQQQGLIAILDALGAANYSGEELSQFLRSRELVREQLNDKAVRLGGPELANRVITFTFNDTVLIVYQTEKPEKLVTLKDVKRFGELLRRFAVKSLAQGIFFRGAVAIGRFYVDKSTNTVMGEAVTDAAAWYNLADWIGIIATPQATLLIQSLTEQGRGEIGRLMVDYPVPLKDGSVLSLKSVNWPKAFFVRGMTPCVAGEKQRAKCLSLLAQHGVPRGTESKYFNSVTFFDHCAELWHKQRKK